MSGMPLSCSPSRSDHDVTDADTDKSTAGISERVVSTGRKCLADNRCFLLRGFRCSNTRDQVFQVKLIMPAAVIIH